MAPHPVFLDAIQNLPPVSESKEFNHWLESVAIKASNPESVRTIVSLPPVRGLLASVFSYSPFLNKLITHHPDFFHAVIEEGPEQIFSKLIENVRQQAHNSTAALMKDLRVAKAQASLLTGLADIAGIWTVEVVTGAMSDVADICVQKTLVHLLQALHNKHDIELKYPDNPQKECGVFVLGMGKLGAYELNYSSDIDLIIFFDRELVHYKGAGDVQQSLSKLVRELVRILQERTADGYVFRVDLRLRPDPASTPAAMSVAGAMTYYETVGQNWERAAFIKARPIAGDMELGFQFLKQISPFVWRKSLDFAAIADIQSIKRQMDERTGKQIILLGHNVKTGIGGIREIEFFAQIHQLIWGGRLIALRQKGTCKTLMGLAENNLISWELADKLIASYRFLRHVEHRLQMVDDQQTHSLPMTEQGMTQLSQFAGFNEAEKFEEILFTHLEFVHENFAGAFRGRNSLSSEQGKLSFTGVENDPQTLETLNKMGYKNPGAVSELIQGWHRGTRRATRTKRARELITELTPTLLEAFAATSQPDQAFVHFDEFLTKLPAGVQLFSLFNVHPELLHLIAIIMGSAPAMAETLSKNPQLLDVVLTVDFYHEFPDRAALFAELGNMLLIANGFEDEMNMVRRFKNEKQFQAGVQLITGRVNTLQASAYLSDIAEVCLESLLRRVEADFSTKAPELKPESLAVVVLGRLGAHELTFGSDIDMLFVYEDSENLESLLPQSHALYNKLSQRYITSITSLMREGRLYEIDTRLRPSGNDGALAVSVSAFEKYFRESAWTFELMAFTRARVITGNVGLREKIKRIVDQNIMRLRSKETLVADIVNLRTRITKEFGSNDPWNLKYVHGGIIDLDFLAQYLVLLHAPANPAVIASSTDQVFRNLIAAKLMDEKTGEQLIEAHDYLNSLLALLRLCGGGKFDEESAPEGMKQLIVAILDLKDFPIVKRKLLDIIAIVKNYFTVAGLVEK